MSQQLYTLGDYLKKYGIPTFEEIEYFTNNHLRAWDEKQKEWYILMDQVNDGQIISDRSNPKYYISKAKEIIRDIKDGDYEFAETDYNYFVQNIKEAYKDEIEFYEVNLQHSKQTPMEVTNDTQFPSESKIEENKPIQTQSEPETDSELDYQIKLINRYQTGACNSFTARLVMFFNDHLYYLIDRKEEIDLEKNFNFGNNNYEQVLKCLQVSDYDTNNTKKVDIYYTIKLYFLLFIFNLFFIENYDFYSENEKKWIININTLIKNSFDRNKTIDKDLLDIWNYNSFIDSKYKKYCVNLSFPVKVFISLFKNYNNNNNAKKNIEKRIISIERSYDISYDQGSLIEAFFQTKLIQTILFPFLDLFGKFAFPYLNFYLLKENESGIQPIYMTLFEYLEEEYIPNNILSKKFTNDKDGSIKCLDYYLTRVGNREKYLQIYGKSIESTYENMSSYEMLDEESYDLKDVFNIWNSCLDSNSVPKHKCQGIGISVIDKTLEFREKMEKKIQKEINEKYNNLMKETQDNQLKEYYLEVRTLLLQNPFAYSRPIPVYARILKEKGYQYLKDLLEKDKKASIEFTNDEYKFYIKSSDETEKGFFKRQHPDFVKFITENEKSIDSENPNLNFPITTGSAGGAKRNNNKSKRRRHNSNRKSKKR